MIEKRDFYIDGKWVSPAIAHDFDVIDPSTEEVCAIISLGSEADTNAAVAAAKRAFETWSLSSKEERLALAERILEVYEKRSDEIAAATSLEMGAPIDMSKVQQAPSGTWHIKNYIRAFKDFEFERVLSPESPNDLIVSEPIGVCGMITPWNWPMNQVTLKVIPAILAGCTMVLKPSEIAPLSSILFTEVLDEAGVPAGVFNMVNGDGLGVGTQLSGHKDVDMMSFTGSTRAGSAISKNAADTVKRVHLELGGKGANIIFNDADETAVKRGALHCFNNTGQSCNAPTRMMVEKDSYEAAVQKASEIANSMTVASAHEEGRHMGPVVSQMQYDKIQEMIQKGIDEGARLVAGGLGRADGLTKGYFVRPTVFADVTNDMSIAQEEIFGPVLSILSFESEEEVVQMANDTVYGLGNYIQSQDPQKCNRVARRLRSGMVEINGQSRGAGSPFGGFKQSGSGREGGSWGIEDYLEVKSISGWSHD